MESPEAYIPIDRRFALARGQELAEHTQGAALFADISGFTPLTDALVRALGPQRGADELPRRLNLVYDALIAEVDRYRGSVIGFSGDAITCWFDADDGLRAVACGLAMQQTMRQFAAVPLPDGNSVGLSIKVAVASGTVRRFVVGDPRIQLVDVLAGTTLETLAACEHVAQTGETVLSAQTAEALREQCSVSEWRIDHATGTRVAVANRLSVEVTPAPWPRPRRLRRSQVRPWLLRPVYERLRSGDGEFLTELRPAVALFLRFGGIDYDSDDDAAAKLDRYVRWVQSVLQRYAGNLIQLTVGDKGSYLYAVWGAPMAHDDDACRAITAALELRSAPPEFAYIRAIQIGISRGRMRTGAYGGQTARTYGVLGPETNMAARLMQHAPPGEVYVAAAAQREAAEDFTWQALPPLRVKGKAEPATVFRLIAAAAFAGLHEPRYTLPMIGRGAELARVAEKLAAACESRGQIVAVVAEAGMGKSRLVAEIMRLAGELQFESFGGECQSYGTNNSYLVWEGLLSSFFGLQSGQTLEQQLEQLETRLGAFDAALTARLPLLGVALNLPIPDNELTGSLDAKLRKASLEALLVDCVRARAAQTPLLLVLEDCHWLDELSHDLLEAIGRAIAGLPVLIVVAYRPPTLERLQAPRVTRLPYCTELRLGEFSLAEAAQLITLKLAQLSGDSSGVPDMVVERIMARAQGNPFYIDELINYVRDRGLDPRDAAIFERLELPTNLHSLVLSRIDQLSTSQKQTITVASVIGRMFRESWLHGVHPQLGSRARVAAALLQLSRLDLTPLDQAEATTTLPGHSEPDLTYIFKHIVTREAAYESLPFDMRSRMHENFATFMEASYEGSLEQYIDLLAYHYDLSANDGKRREYLRKGGEAAQAAYANEAAIDYYKRLLALLGDAGSETIELRQQVSTRLGELLANTGRYDDALQQLDTALSLARHGANPEAEARACRWIAYVHEFRGDFPAALDWIKRGLAALQSLHNRPAAEAELLAIAGLIATRHGDYAQAQLDCDRGVELALALDEPTALAFAYNSRAIISFSQGRSADAITYFERALGVYEQTGNIHGQAMSCNGMGNTYKNMGNWNEANSYTLRARDTFSRTGDVLHLAFANNNLGEIARNQGRTADAIAAYGEALRSLQQLGASPYVIGVLHMNLGAALIQQPDLRAATGYLHAANAYFEQANSKDFLPELYRHFAVAALVDGDYDEAGKQANQALRLARELSMRGEEGSSLRTLGEISIGRGDVSAAELLLSEGLAILEDVQYEYEAARTRFWLSAVLDTQGKHELAADMRRQAIAVFDRISAPTPAHESRQ